MPQDLCERTLYNWVARPHVRPAGGSRDAGETTIGELMSDEPSCEMQFVVPQRQVGGQFESGLADQSAVEIVRGPVVFQLTQAGPDGPVLQPDPQARPGRRG